MCCLLDEITCPEKGLTSINGQVAYTLFTITGEELVAGFRCVVCSMKSPVQKKALLPLMDKSLIHSSPLLVKSLLPDLDSTVDLINVTEFCLDDILET
jgi:hypothetical protein